MNFETSGMGIMVIVEIRQNTICESSVIDRNKRSERELIVVYKVTIYLHRLLSYEIMND